MVPDLQAEHGALAGDSKSAALAGTGGALPFKLARGGGRRSGPGPRLRVNFSLRLLAGPRMLPTAATAAGGLAARRRPARPARRDSGRHPLMESDWGTPMPPPVSTGLSTPIWHWGRKAKAGPRSRANGTLDRPAIGVVRSCTASTESQLSDSESRARAGPSAGYYRPGKLARRAVRGSFRVSVAAVIMLLRLSPRANTRPEVSIRT